MEEITQEVVDKMDGYNILMTLFAEKALDNKKNKEQFKKIKNIYFKVAKQAFYDVTTTSTTKKLLASRDATNKLIEALNSTTIEEVLEKASNVKI